MNFESSLNIGLCVSIISGGADPRFLPEWFFRTFSQKDYSRIFFSPGKRFHGGGDGGRYPLLKMLMSLTLMDLFVPTLVFFFGTFALLPEKKK